MSAPVTEFQQPPFSQGEGAATEPKPEEPTNDEIDTSSTRKKLSGRALATVIASSFMLFFAILFIVLMIAGYFRTPTTTHTSSVPIPSRACPNGQVELEKVNETETATSTYCATQAEYDALYAEAEAQYTDGLTRGKPVYTKWLKTHKLDSAKTEGAQQMAAQTYICSVDFNDGSLYAATKAGLSEDFVQIAIGNYLIEVDGYNPEEVSCYNGTPVPPKQPNRNPVPLPEGGTGSNNGPVDAP